MGVHWTDKRAAKARLAHALMERGGWRLFGYKPDRSDMQTDYYDPPAWDGIARHESGAVLVVDRNDTRDSGELPKVYGRRRVADCERCKGTGAEPGGWKLRDAQAEPERWHQDHDRRASELHRGRVTSLCRNAVSPHAFLDEDDRAERCQRCAGSGGVYEATVTDAPEDERWPVWQPNPGRCSWHVERGGVILGRGTGVFSIENDHRGGTISEERARANQRAAKFLDVIEDAVSASVRVTVAEIPSENGRAAEGVVVRAGKYEDSVEVVFPEKPAAEVIAALKLAAFRWHRTGAYWYGKRANLPGFLQVAS